MSIIQQVRKATKPHKALHLYHHLTIIQNISQIHIQQAHSHQHIY